MNSRPEAQSRQLPQNSNLTCLNSTQVQETANNAEALPCVAGDHFFMRLAAGLHLGQAHGSVQLVLVLCKHRTLGGLAGTVLLALPHPPSPQCCHSSYEASSSSWERPSCKRTSEGSHQPHNQVFLPQLVQVEDAQREKVPHHKRSRTPVGRWRYSPVFNSKVTNRPNCCHRAK